MKDIKPDAGDYSRERLAAFEASARAEQQFDDLMKQMSHINAGGKFNRDDMTSRTTEISKGSK